MRRRDRSAPWRRSAEHGFTLIELMVALLIFAMLAAAGVVLLSSSLSAQTAVRDKLDGLADVQRAAALLSADLAQAIPRVSRTEQGTLAPAFFAAGGAQADPAVQFVRTGRDNPDAQPRSALQKLEYGVVGGALVRRAYPQVDGAAPEPDAVLLDRVTGAQFRFRDDGGAWSDDWRATDPLLLPRAVELTVARAGRDPVRLVFMVGVDPLPRATTGG